MRKLMFVAAALAAFAVPSVSNAQVSLGLRLGYAPAMGEAAKDDKMSDGLKSQIPVQIDALYQVIPNLKVGAYFAYGLGQAGGDFKDSICDHSGVDCALSSMRLGVQAQYAFAPVSGFAPWAGAGIGYEWGNAKAEADGESLEITYSGLEFLNLQGGADYKIAEKFSVGPFLQLSIAQYSNVKIEDSIDPTSNFDGDIEEKGVHQWLQFGVRGTFDL